MATTRFSSHKKLDPGGPMVHLSAAICEWFLIFLLFVDATFSYILRRFAEYCELPAPCLFCSRIDKPFGKRKFECYNALLCGSHREEVSSLVSCHVHGNLTDVREMCEECFVPISIHDKLNPGSNMVCQLGSDIEQRSVRTILPTSGPRICSCCNKSWGAEPIAQRSLKKRPDICGVSVANVKPPLPQVQRRNRFSRKNSFKKLRNRTSAPATPRPDGKSSDAFSQVGCKKLKYTSDTESQLPFPDEEGVFGVQGKNNMNPEHDPHHVARTLLKLQRNDSALEKESNQSVADASLLDQPSQLDTQETLPAHGLEDLNWDELHSRTNSPVAPELKILDDVIDHLSNVSGDVSLYVEAQPQMSSSGTPAEPITLSNSPLCIKEKNQEILESQDEDNMILSREPINATSSPASTNEEKEVSTISVDLPSASASPKFKDIKSVLEQSTPEEADYQKEMLTTSVELPSASGSTEFKEIKTVLQQSAPTQDNTQDVGAPSSDENHVQAAASLEENYSNFQFEERVTLSDVEGEISIEMLKSEIEHIKKCMNDLYRELEEERNASTISANQAMAMITRLQEEKAALHMEASQYLRMMDEQAEYDTEALQRANDLLAEKDKELQDLEYELESYRNNGGPPVIDPHNESISTMSGKENELQDLDYELESFRNNMHGGPPVIDPHNESINTMEQYTTIRLNDSSSCEPSSPESSKMGISDISVFANRSMSNLKEQKLSLEDYLMNLERRIHVASCNNTPRGGLNSSRHHELDSDKPEYQEIPLTNEEDYSDNEGDGSPSRNWLSGVDRTSEDSPTYLFDDGNAYEEETNHNRSNWHNLSIAGHEPTLEAFEHEIANFKERLKAFEGDWEFIKHSLSNFKMEVKGWNIFNR